MPEEINRVLTDILSDLLFITEESAIGDLRRESILKERIYFVRNTMVDTLLHEVRCQACADRFRWHPGRHHGLRPTLCEHEKQHGTTRDPGNQRVGRHAESRHRLTCAKEVAPTNKVQRAKVL